MENRLFWLTSSLSGLSLERAIIKTGSFSRRLTATGADLQFAQTALREGAGVEDAPIVAVEHGEGGLMGRVWGFRVHLRGRLFVLSGLLFCRES